MKNNFKKIVKNSIIVVTIAILWDAFFHYFFSEPFETFGYFAAKGVLYFLFAIVFFYSQKELNFKVSLIGGLIVASMWGAYYNLVPVVIGYVPFGISLSNLSVLGINNYLFTGLFFGVVHVVGFMWGVYIAEMINR